VRNLLSRIKGKIERLRVFEKRVLRKTLEPKREEIMGGWRGPHNEELIICTLHKYY
jgi:hypothetical protein